MSTLNDHLSTDEKIAFDMYFASVCSMQVHPGAGTKDHAKLTLLECREMALDMLRLRRELMNSGD